MRRFIAATVLALLVAIPAAEARPRDPVGQFLAGLGKAFEPQKRITRKRHVSAPRKATAVAKQITPDAPEITVRPAEPPLANASGLKVLPDDRVIRDLVGIYAGQHGIEPKVALALVKAESNFDPWATGSAGEIGLGQIKCPTAKQIGYRGSCRDLYGVAVNLRYSMKYLAHAKRLSDGTQCGMLSKYNGGLYSDGHRKGYCDRIKRAMEG